MAAQKLKITISSLWEILDTVILLLTTLKRNHFCLKLSEKVVPHRIETSVKKKLFYREYKSGQNI